jgi:hypothetical protein
LAPTVKSSLLVLLQPPDSAGFRVSSTQPQLLLASFSAAQLPQTLPSVATLFLPPLAQTTSELVQLLCVRTLSVAKTSPLGPGHLAFPLETAMRVLVTVPFLR